MKFVFLQSHCQVHLSNPWHWLSPIQNPGAKFFQSLSIKPSLIFFLLMYLISKSVTFSFSPPLLQMFWRDRVAGICSNSFLETCDDMGLHNTSYCLSLLNCLSKVAAFVLCVCVCNKYLYLFMHT